MIQAAFRRSIIFLFIIGVTFGAATEVYSKTGATLKPAQTLDEIIKRYYEAIGGYTKLKSIKTIRLTGVYEEGTNRFNTYIEWKRPHYRVVVIGVPDEFYREAFNGQAWEFSASGGILKFTDGAAADAGRRGAEFDESIFDYQEKGHKVTFVGREKLWDRDVFHLEVNLKDGWQKHYYLDSKTYLIAALRKAMPLHAEGDAIESLSSYEEYKPVGGVIYPHRFVERRTQTGEIMNTLKWDKIETNILIDDKQFYPPTGVYRRQTGETKGSVSINSNL